MPDAIPDPFRSAPWRDAENAIPESAALVPTMLSEEEQRLLVWLTRDYAQGVGEVCDLGCFLGGSTARLAVGAANAGLSAHVHAFDHFTIQDDLKEKYLYPTGIPRFAGDNMIHLSKQYLRPWQDRVIFHPGDIRDAEWGGSPIEILFIDAGKTPGSTDRIAELFMPFLIPGRSIVVQQDYQHWRQPWIAAQMERLSPAFELCGWCEKGTVFYRCTSPITKEVLGRGRVSELDDTAMIDALRAAAGRFPEQKPRRKIARAIMAVQDNPGERLPYRMKNDGFSGARVRELLQTF